MKIFYQNLKLTQLLSKLQITDINWYNMFGELTTTLHYEISTMW